ILTQRIVQLELARALELQDGGSRERLGDGGDMELGFLGMRDAPLVIGHPVRLLKHDATIACDENRPAEVAVVNVSLNLMVVACAGLGSERGNQTKETAAHFRDAKRNWENVSAPKRPTPKCSPSAPRHSSLS